MFDDIEFYLQDLKSKFEKLKNTGYKYYLSYSGGKDSHFIFWFIRVWLKDNAYELYIWCLENIVIVGCNTYMEHPEILKRINKNSDRVLFPKLKPFEIKEKYGIPCFSKSQDDFIDRYQRGSRAKSTLERVYGDGEDGNWTKFKLNKKAKELLLSNKLHKVSPKCCKYLKKEPFKLYEKETGKKGILGVRGGESNLRKSKYTSCFTKDKKFTPIYDLSDEMLNKIYEKYNIEIPKVYDYIDRTGCMGCPYGSWKKKTQKELELITPQQKKFVCELFKESYKVLGILKDEDIQDSRSQ